MHKLSNRKMKLLVPRYDLSDLRNIYDGQKCFICGAGPSIGGLDLKDIHQHVVISVNSSILLMPWQEGSADRRYWVSNDSLCMKWDYFWKYVLRANCTKIVRISWRRQEDKIKGRNFRYFKPRFSERQPLLIDAISLCKTSSIPTAIDLAILMGCKSIYLLGVDHALSQGKSHFWQFYPLHERPQRIDKIGTNFIPDVYQQMQIFNENIPVYKSLKELADRSKISIYNCSYRSHVDEFEKISLEKALYV